MIAVLQFDAAAPVILDGMLAEGRLPTLARLAEQNRRQPLEAATDFFEAGIYPSLYTGVEIREHGLYYPLVWSADEQRVRYMDTRRTPATVWERLGRAGRRSVVIDPYQIWKTGAAPGTCISGWQFRHKIIPRWSMPSSSYRSFARRLGAAPLLPDVSGTRSAATLLGMRKVLLAAPSRAAALALELLAGNGHDLVWITFGSAHQAGHHFWDLSCVDERVESATRAELEHTLTDVYAEVDAALSVVLEALPAGADVIVLSPLGMGPNTMRSDLLPDMLEAVLARDREGHQRRDGAGSAIWRTRAAFPVGVRTAFARALPGGAVRETLARLYYRGVDWSRTRAFVLPGDHYGYVRLNLRGRERDGIVDPAKASALMDEISAGLRTFRDHDGSSAVATVERVAERIGGPHVDELPDLVVRWSQRPTSRLTAVHSTEFGEVVRRAVGTGRSGNHWRGAWAIVVPGRSRRTPPGRAPRIVDIAATVCASAGVDASDLPGRPLVQP